MLGKKFVYLLVAINLILLAGNLFWFHKPAAPTDLSSQYPFLSKRVFIDNPNDLIINFVGLRNELNNYTKPLGSSIGMYFEYLPTGNSIGINQNNEIRLASLSKVPTVMAIYRQISEGKLSLNDTVTLKSQFKDASFGTLWKEPTSSQVPVSQAINLAITQSDNTAHNLLLSLLTSNEINDVYYNLDIPFDFQNGYPLISSYSYSSILRALYLSSYLSRDYSNQILSLMTQTIYHDKLPGKLPNNIKVAHKIGVFQKPDDSQSSYSDCGIVYVPNRPYLLCVEYDGTNQDATNHISTISKMIYDYVSKK